MSLTRAILLCAASFPCLAAAQSAPEAGAKVAVASCLSETVPWMSFEAVEVSGGVMTDVTGRAGSEGGALMRAASVRCTQTGIEADRVAFFPDASVLRLLDEGTGLMADKVIMDKPREGCFLGAVPGVTNVRLFHWRSGNSGDSEIVMRISGEDIYRPLVYKIAATQVSFIPRPTKWDCAVSGDFHLSKPSVSFSSARGGIKGDSDSALIGIDMPLSVDSYSGVGGDFGMSVFLSHPNINIGLSRAGSVGSAHFDFRFSSGAPLVSYFLRYVPDIVLPQSLSYPYVPFANLSNIISMSSGEVSVKIEDVSLRPQTVFGGYFLGDYSGFSLLSGSVSGKAKIGDGVISADAGILFDGLGSLTLNAGVAPRRFGADDAESLRSGDYRSPLLPRRMKATFVGQDTGLASLLSSVYGYDLKPVGDIMAGFISDMRSGSAVLRVTMDDAVSKE